MIPLQIEFYDRKESLLKTLEFRDYRQYLDRYLAGRSRCSWRITRPARAPC